MDRPGANAHTLDLLAGVPLFGGCSRKELREVSRLAEVVDVPAEHLLIRQDDIGREFFILVSGSAQIVRNGQVIGELAPGDFAGELALIDRAPRAATVVTTSASQVLVFGQREFSSVLALCPNVDRRLLERVVAQLRQAEAPDSERDSERDDSEVSSGNGVTGGATNL